MLLVRSNGGKSIGMGHVYRSMTIARCMRDRFGIPVRFIVNGKEAVRTLLRANGFDWDEADGELGITDLRSILDRTGGRDGIVALIDAKPDVSSEIGAFHAFGIPAVLVDNTTPARLLADANIYPAAHYDPSSLTWNGYRGRIAGGKDYVPLATAFLDALGSLKPPQERKSILVTMGGSDPNRLTLKVMDALFGFSEDIEIHVVLGPAFVFKEEAYAKNALLGQRFSIVENVGPKEMASLMAGAGLAVTALGTTIYELACMRVPAAVITNYPEDEPEGVLLKKLGCLRFSAYHEKISVPDFHLVLLDLWKTRRPGWTENVIDGRGAERIAAFLLEYLPRTKGMVMSRIHLENDHSGPVLNSVSGYDIIDCARCGFKHIVPIPAEEELDSIYRQEYYSTEKPLYLEHTREDIEWWNMVFSERYEMFEGVLGSNRRRILDIGSGPGFFLLNGKMRGWDTFGIEPSLQAVTHSRDLGLNILQGFFTDETPETLPPFDAIQASEVLEHIPHPARMLRSIHRLLSPGGLVCVVVPNDYNPFQQALVKACSYEPWWISPPHHINYFDSDSIGKLIVSCGFEIVISESTFPIDIFLLMGDDYTKDDRLGRRCHAKRKAFELNLAAAGLSHLKRRLYRSLAGSGIGREILVIARKAGSRPRVRTAP